MILGEQPESVFPEMRVPVRGLLVPEFFFTGLNCTICNVRVIRGMGNLLSSEMEGCLQASREDSGWL